MLSGEYDLATSGRLRRQLLDCKEPLVVASLADVTFMDVSAVRTIMEARHLLAEQGRRLELVDVPPMGRRLLHLAGLATELLQSSEPSWSDWS